MLSTLFARRLSFESAEVELGGVPEPGAVDLLGPPSRPTTSVYAGESQSAGAVIAGASEVDVRQRRAEGV